MMFGIDSLYIWLAVIIISVAVEAFTLTLCGIWFAAGGVAALIAASSQPDHSLINKYQPTIQA